MAKSYATLKVSEVAQSSTVHGVRRVRHDIVTKPLPPSQVVPHIFVK